MREKPEVDENFSPTQTFQKQPINLVPQLLSMFQAKQKDQIGSNKMEDHNMQIFFLFLKHTDCTLYFWIMTYHYLLIFFQYYLFSRVLLSFSSTIQFSEYHQFFRILLIFSSTIQSPEYHQFSRVLLIFSSITGSLKYYQFSQALFGLPSIISSPEYYWIS